MTVTNPLLLLQLVTREGAASVPGDLPVRDGAHVLLQASTSEQLSGQSLDALSWRLVPAASVVVSTVGDSATASLCRDLTARGIHATPAAPGDSERVEGSANPRGVAIERRYGVVGLRGHVQQGARVDLYLRAGHLTSDDLGRLGGHLSRAGLVYVAGGPSSAVQGLRDHLRAMNVQAEACPWHLQRAPSR